MPLEKLEYFTKKVSDLSDKPNATMTATEVKEHFDAAPDEVRIYLNNLISNLLSTADGDSGADNIGVTPISTSPGKLQGVLEWLKTQMDDIVLGQIPDGTVVKPKDLAYKLATGTGTEITITTGTLIDGYSITFIASANNNGAATKINGKSLFKPNTTVAPTLISGKAYTVWYNTENDCFFIKASAEGKATTAQVLAGVPFSNEEDTDLIGTMPNRGVGGTITPSTVNQTKQFGYYSSEITVLGDADLIASNILSGKNIFGVDGNSQPKTVVSWSTPGANLNNGESHTSRLGLGKTLPTPHLLVAKSYGSLFNGSSMYSNGNTEQSSSSDRYPVRIGFDPSTNEIWVNISNNSGSLTNGVYATVYGIY